MYPDLRGKGYMGSLEASQEFDHAVGVPTVFKLYVGAGPKGFATGSANGKAVYAEQYLSSEFTFGTAGLIAFNAQGSAIGNSEQLHKLAELRENHPTVTDLQATGTLIQSGAKFGSWNKDEFLRALPISKLQPFIGRVSVVSAEFTVPNKEHMLPHEWPSWTVRAKAVPVNGAELIYQMTFEPFRGDLTSLTTVPFPPDARAAPMPE
jgi:hypothetical protein